jgi:large subunit ribosomal protein L22
VPGTKTNERPGTRAVLRHCRMSSTKARVVLNLIRGQDVDRAAEILRSTPREAAEIVGKVLASAVANAVHNDGADAEELYVSACYADEGVTLKRWRPRARGRATRIRKRSCHITVIVSRMPEERLVRRRAERQAAGSQRQRRVAESRRRADLAGRLSRRRHAAEAEAEARAEAARAADSAEVQLDEAEVQLDEAEVQLDESEGLETARLAGEESIEAAAAPTAVEREGADAATLGSTSPADENEKGE